MIFSITSVYINQQVPRAECIPSISWRGKYMNRSKSGSPFTMEIQNLYINNVDVIISIGTMRLYHNLFQNKELSVAFLLKKPEIIKNSGTLNTYINK